MVREGAMRSGRIAADADDLGTGIAEHLVIIAKATRLGGAPAGLVPGIEIEHYRLPAPELRQGDGSAFLVGKGEVGCEDAGGRGAYEKDRRVDAETQGRSEAGTWKRPDPSASRARGPAPPALPIPAEQFPRSPSLRSWSLGRVPSNAPLALRPPVSPPLPLLQPPLQPVKARVFDEQEALQVVGGAVVSRRVDPQVHVVPRRRPSRSGAASCSAGGRCRPSSSGSGAGVR